MATYTVTTNDAQEAALAALVDLRNKQKLDPKLPDETAQDLVQAWALHPLEARLAEARRATVQSQAVDVAVAALTSEDPELRAEAEAVQQQIEVLAERVRGGRAQGAGGRAPR